MATDPIVSDAVSEICHILENFRLGQLSDQISENLTRIGGSLFRQLEDEISKTVQFLDQSIHEHEDPQCFLSPSKKDGDLSLSMLQTLIENLPVAVFLKDAEDGFKIKLWNKAAEELFEIPKEDILEKTVHDLWPKDQADLYLSADTKTVQEEALVDIAEEPSQSKTRGTIYFHTRKVPLKIGNKVRYLLCISNDITELRQARLDALGLAEQAKNQRDQLQRLIDGVPAFISHWDKNLINISSNRSFASQCGENPEQMRGRHYSEVLGPLYDQVKDKMERALLGEKVSFEARIVSEDGAARY